MSPARRATRGRRRRRAIPPACWAALLPLLLCAGAPAAEVRLKLPLSGYYRPGRYMPVHVLASGVSGGQLTLLADNAAPLKMELAGGGIDSVVPLLPFRAPLQNLRWSDAAGEHPVDLHFQALGETDCLLGCFGSVPDHPGALCPGRTPVVLSMDLSGAPLLPAPAWETLDLIVLDTVAASRVATTQVGDLLAGGSGWVVAAREKPAGAWPWKREPYGWELRYRPAGPEPVFDAGVYRPADGWVRGRSVDARRLVMLVALSFSILVLGLLLWRSRWAWPAGIVLSAAFAAGWTHWSGKQSSAIEQSAAVETWSDSIVQRDRWTWRSSLSPVRASETGAGAFHPVFASWSHALATSPELTWRPASQTLSWSVALSRQTTVAFLSRTIAPAQAPAPPAPAPLQGPAAISPLAEWVGRAYVGGDDVLLGERPEQVAGATLGSLIVRRTKPQGMSETRSIP